MNNTNLAFILGSGRCGTKALVKMLAGTPDLEAHHEYVRYYYQKEAVLYFEGLISCEEMCVRLASIYDGATYYSEAKTFLDSSHKLVWCADVLQKTYPKAKYVHLIRDGRKVASSFYNKLNIHQDKATKEFREYKASIKWETYNLPMPPPSEKYWWPTTEYNTRWERICWYWATMNDIIERFVVKSDSESIQIRLEDLTTNINELKRFLDFVEVPFRASYWDALQRPDHVYVPINYSLSSWQREKFNEIATSTMERLGYNINEDEYNVKY